MSLVLLFETQEVWALKYVHFKIQKKHNYLQATLSSVSVQYPTFSSRPFPNKSTKNHPSEIWKKNNFVHLFCAALSSWVAELSPMAKFHPLPKFSGRFLPHLKGLSIQGGISWKVKKVKMQYDLRYHPAKGDGNRLGGHIMI